MINVVAFGLSPVADPGGGDRGIYPTKHTFWPPIRMNLSIIISLLGTTIPNYNVFFVATIPNSNWWPGASPLDPTGTYNAPQTPNWVDIPSPEIPGSATVCPPLPNIAGYATAGKLLSFQSAIPQSNSRENDHHSFI